MVLAMYLAIIITQRKYEIPLNDHNCFKITQIAGGLATFLHAGVVQTLIPENANYKALPDAG